jgi:hypothetical protein
MFLLVFTSCAFVPLRSLPGRLQAVGATARERPGHRQTLTILSGQTDLLPIII